MTSNSKLEKLKQQVRDTSNQQMLLQLQRNSVDEAIRDREYMQYDNKQEMMQLVRSVFEQNEIASAKERELFKDQLDRFSHRQSVMNEQLITLNDNLKDTTSLQAVYAAKREQLEIDYRYQKDALQEQLDVLTDQIESRKNDLERINEEISTNTSKLEELVAETEKATFKSELRKTWRDKWLSFAIVGFLGMIAGGFFGWGVFTIVGNIFSAIGDFFGRFISFS